MSTIKYVMEVLVLDVILMTVTVKLVKGQLNM